MSMGDPTEISMAGKTVPVFTAKNLESMSPQNLRMRGLDLRDLLQTLGAGDVSMPRHQEALRDWIIATQNSLLGMGGGAPQAAPQQRMQPQDQMMRPQAEPRGMPAGYAPSETAMTDNEEAYSAARAGAAASRNRNQGSTNILTWA
jgi:hypothetical protein